jgi:hypothetical protein
VLLLCPTANKNLRFAMEHLGQIAQGPAVLGSTARPRNSGSRSDQAIEKPLG